MQVYFQHDDNNNNTDCGGSVEPIHNFVDPNPAFNHSRITLNLNYRDQLQEVRSEEWACVFVLG
jgi:hypothetical protein